MKQYYYSEEGEKKGPFPLSDFQNINITSETLIWSEGFSVWTRAKDLEEFVPILSMKPPTLPNAAQSSTVDRDVVDIPENVTAKSPNETDKTEHWNDTRTGLIIYAVCMFFIFFINTLASNSRGNAGSAILMAWIIYTASKFAVKRFFYRKDKFFKRPVLFGIGVGILTSLVVLPIVVGILLLILYMTAI